MEQLLYDKMNWEQVEGVVYSDLKKPFDILGPHLTEDGVRICYFIPEAQKVCIRVKKTGKLIEMSRLDDAGFYAALLPGKRIFSYTYLITLNHGTEIELEDPYAFSPTIREKDLELFAQGIHYQIYQVLGAHKKTISGVDGVQFAVWAPNAMRVSVVGTFNNWDGRRHMMELKGES